MILVDISGKKKKAYLKTKFEEHETRKIIKNIRGLYRRIYEFKLGYQSRTNIVKDDKADLVADSNSILARWRNYFSQMLNVHGFNDVRQTKLHTADPLVTEPSASEIELPTDGLKSHKSPGIDQIPVELIKAGGKTICCEIHKLSISNEIRRKAFGMEGVDHNTYL